MKSQIPEEGFTRYIPSFSESNGRIHLRILGPNRWDGTVGYWAGEWTPEEFMKLGFVILKYGILAAEKQARENAKAAIHQLKSKVAA